MTIIDQTELENSFKVTSDLFLNSVIKDRWGSIFIDGFLIVNDINFDSQRKNMLKNEWDYMYNDFDKCVDYFNNPVPEN